MEQQIATFLVFFTFLVVVLIAILSGKRYKAKYTAPKLPPGPWKLPLIGNMHQLVGSLPHHSLRDLAMKHGPLMHLTFGEVSTIVVSSPEMAKEIMKTHDIIFAGRPYHLASRIMSYDSTDIVFSPYGDYWRQLRKICRLELLTVKRVQSFQSIREDAISNLIKTISPNARVPINLSEKISSLTYGVVSMAAFGKKCKDQKAFISAINKSTKLAGGFSVADMYPSIKFLPVVTGLKRKLEKQHFETDRILEDIIQEHKHGEKTTKTGVREEAKEDLVDVLLRLQADGDLDFPLTDNNIKAVILDMFSAGGETSSMVIEWAMSEMLKNPRVLKKAQAEVRHVFDVRENVDESSLHELKYLNAVIKETLRLHPPVPLIHKECRQNCEINGYVIPVKTSVIVNAWAIGRDPEYWNEAERFYPERFMDSPIDYKGTHFEYIPFGAGRRICPGISFGIANIELPLAQLLYHFDWELPDGMKNDDSDKTESFGLSVGRKRDLYLIPTPYHPLPAE